MLRPSGVLHPPSVWPGVFCVVTGFSAMLMSIALMDARVRRPPLPTVVLLPVFLASGAVASLPLALLVSAVHAVKLTGFLASAALLSLGLFFLGSVFAHLMLMLRVVSGPRT